MNYPKTVINIAKAEIGYLEKASNRNLDDPTANAGGKNWTKYGRDIDAIEGINNGKKNGYDWCAVFVQWCFVKAYGVDAAKKMLALPDKSYGASCKWGAIYYKNVGRFYSSPEIGDQCFFRDSHGDCIHTGIVVDIDANYVYTIEGNTSSVAGVVANGGCVRDKKYARNYKYFAGFGRPTYDPEPLPEKKNVAVGDIVDFVGKVHYTNANAKTGRACKPGKAKVTATYNGLHPYHLIRVSGGGSTVYGWVDPNTISAYQPIEDPHEDIQCEYVVQKGDCLWAIAVKFLGGGSRYKEIMTLNGMKSATIHVGDKIKIPNK